MKKARSLVALVAALLLCSVVTLAASGALEGETAGEPAAQPPEKVDLGLGGLQGVPLSAQEEDWISREEAIAAAKLQTYAGEDAETIQASLVRLSDTECPVLPESDITLTDRPAWVVTFHNVGIMLHGPAKGGTRAGGRLRHRGCRDRGLVGEGEGPRTKINFPK